MNEVELDFDFGGDDEQEFWSKASDFARNDIMINSCQTLKSAKSTLLAILNTATNSEIELVAKAYYRISSRKLKKTKVEKKKVGGRHETEHDYRVYRLLELADICHDFFNNDETPEDTEIEITKFISDNNYILPKGLTANSFVKSNLTHVFIPFMAKHKQLKFNDAIVDNPLYNCNILVQFEIKPDHKSMNDIITSQQHSIKTTLGNLEPRTFIPIDIYMNYSLVEKKKAIVQLVQIAQLIALMIRRFGSFCVFEIDSSDNHLVAFICATQYMSEAFKSTFDTEPLSGNVAEISKKLTVAISEAGLVYPEWTQFTTDANIFDAVNNALALPLDHLPTGKVFRCECGYQVELGGITVSGPQRIKHIPIIITDSDGTIWNKPLTNRETTNTVSKKVLTNSIAIGKVSIPKNPNFSQQVAGFTTPLKYALKRAGDWGQVEHCRKYNKVFVTSDKIAAMYAYYRDVKVMFLRRQERGADEQLSHLPDFLRYTFVLS